MRDVTCNVPLLVDHFTFNQEPETYPYICDLLHTGLNHSGVIAAVYDTNNNPYLEGYKPDITITLPGLQEPDPASVCIIVEIKFHKLKSAPDKKAFGTSSDFGQLYDYLLAVQRAQPERRTIVGVLSDVDRNYVVTLGQAESGHQVTHYCAESIFAVLAYLHDIALRDPAYRPPRLGFSLELGDMRRRLGNPRYCVVGEFPVPIGTPGTVMAVKLTTKKSRESYFLDIFKRDSYPHPCLPSIVYNLRDEDLEIGITPVGIQLEPTMSLNPQQARGILNDITSAVQWLHLRHIIHRDIRCENIVLHNSRAILIDFDLAFFLLWSVPTTYSGGHICIPPTHLKGIIAQGWQYQYCPALSDDCYAVLLLAYILLFPSRFAGFRPSRITEPGSLEGPWMVNFWHELSESQMWGGLMALAEKGAVEQLNLTQIFY